MPDTEHNSPPLDADRISTDDVAPSERVAFWNRIGTETFRAEIAVTPMPGSEFRGVLARRTHDTVLLTHVENSPATVRGVPAPRAAREPEHTTLFLQDVGTTDHHVGGTRLRLHAGTATMTPPQPFTIAFQELTRCIILQLPTARLAARLGDPARLAGTRVEADDTALLTTFVRTILDQGSPAREPGWDEAIGEGVLDLIAIAYRRHKHAAVASSRANEQWRRTVRDFVEQHLEDPELGAVMIAHRMGVTPRYVQVVFASMATTATAYIRGRRLELAAQLLARNGGPIADVAYRVGFADLSYFYRSFRKRFGLSPKRYAVR